ncbi:MAG: flagellar hook-associated protein FlgK [Sedimentisphaerales bacterium]|nr:flagellar hook-associated protein FlgK [Sedimentisphaerales bacterium]
MALINGALQIGRSAITASQAALAVTGNNMANAATPGYSRQNVQLAPTQYTEVMPGKYTGTGVILQEVRRQIDDALNGRIRTAVGESASYLVQQQTMMRVEAAFNELTDQDLSTRLNSLFSSFSALQSQPHDIASRSVVLQEGASLTNFVREVSRELTSIQEDLDAQVRYQVEQADALANQIADLNQQVAVAEAGRGGSAAALRDQRDMLLKELSGLISITDREVEGGSVNVFIGSEPLIQYSDSRGLSYVETEDANGNKLAQIVFSDNEDTVALTSGKIYGQITTRDDQVGGVIDDLDNWTKAMIFEVNKLHSLGRGLDGFTSVTSSLNVDDADASLAATAETGLPWQASNGVFFVQVYDSNGDAISGPQMVEVNIGMGGTDTTLNSLAVSLNNVNGITASVDGSNYLQIDATTSGHTFAFSAPTDSGDATDALAALGINTFFDGYNASTMDVRTDLAADPRQLAAGANGLPGNGDVAGQIAQLATSGVTSLNGLSINDKFRSIVGGIATDSKAAQDNYTAADVVVETLELERQSISGVSIDEEAMHMIVFQRAFQGAARYISLIDQLLDEVIALAG